MISFGRLLECSRPATIESPKFTSYIHIYIQVKVTSSSNILPSHSETSNPRFCGQITRMIGFKHLSNHSQSTTALETGLQTTRKFFKKTTKVKTVSKTVLLWVTLPRNRTTVRAIISSSLPKNSRQKLTKV